jgi:hypothetical protein
MFSLAMAHEAFNTEGQIANKTVYWQNDMTTT